MINRFLFVLLILPLTALAESSTYPDMVGKWSGDVRIVESGRGTEGDVARGGMRVRDVVVTVNIEVQEGETFMGSTRNSAMQPNQASNRVWGTIRSSGKEAIFVTSGDSRGQLWFSNDSNFEFCVTGITEDLATAYCANLEKQK